MPIDFSDCFPKRDLAPAPTQRRIDPREVLDQLNAREEQRQAEWLARLEREAASAGQAQLLDQRLEARRARARQIAAREARAAVEAERRRAASRAKTLSTSAARSQSVERPPHRSIRYPFPW